MDVGPISAEARTNRRRAEVKARLRTAMLELLAETSFRDLRIEDIAEAAGLSRSAFYFYYSDKQELLIEATDAMSDALFEQADRWWHGQGEPAALITEALEGVAGLWVENEVLLRTATEVSTYDERMRVFWHQLVSRFVEATAEFISREQGDRSIDLRVDPRGTAETLIWGAERSLYVFIFASTGGRPIDELVDSLAAVWLRALYCRYE
ncbi:MAG: TetR/AcrR family transcriptional regulator [Solirubrobacterales bacterium]